MLLIDKYKPKNYEEIKGQDIALKKLQDFTTSFKNFKQKYALIYGPSGVGKTTSVYNLAEKLDLELVELNASNFRNKEAINNIIGNSLKQKSLFCKGKLILIDDMDGISGNNDRGGLQELMNLTEITPYPIIFTMNDIEPRKFEKVIKKAFLIEFKRLEQNIILSLLKEICNKEKINYSEEDLLKISKYADGDLRAAILDLETCIENKKLLPEATQVLGNRIKHEEIIKILNTIFKLKDAKIIINSADNSDINLIDPSPYVGPVIFDNENTLFYWLEENIPAEYSGDSLIYAYDKLSKADVFHGRILNRQHWDFLIYIRNLLFFGVSIANKTPSKLLLNYKKTKRSPKNNFKLWPLVNSRKRKIAEKFAGYTYISTRRAIKDMPYFKFIIKDNNELAKDLNLTEEEAEWLDN